MSLFKPLKRSKQLAPLSREHRDILLFAFNVRLGINNSTPAAEMREYVQWYWNNLLEQHFRQEEDILLADLPATDELSKRLRIEHSNITELITGPLSKSALTIVAEVLKDHIRFEERQLYPHVERMLTRDQLNNIYRQLEQQPHCNEKWENEFWKRKL